jgi:hypothetical protein
MPTCPTKRDDMATVEYLEALEAEVREAARVLRSERYYEHIDCLYELIYYLKYYQRLTESMLNGVTGHRTFKENEAETNRAHNEVDYYRFKDRDEEV